MELSTPPYTFGYCVCSHAMVHAFLIARLCNFIYSGASFPVAELIRKNTFFSQKRCRCLHTASAVRTGEGAEGPLPPGANVKWRCPPPPSFNRQKSWLLPSESKLQSILSQMFCHVTIKRTILLTDGIDPHKVRKLIRDFLTSCVVNIDLMPAVSSAIHNKINCMMLDEAS